MVPVIMATISIRPPSTIQLNHLNDLRPISENSFNIKLAVSGVVVMRAIVVVGAVPVVMVVVRVRVGVGGFGAVPVVMVVVRVRVDGVDACVRVYDRGIHEFVHHGVNLSRNR